MAWPLIEVAVPTLCKHDFNDWYIHVLHALITDGTVQAIKEPLLVFECLR